MNDEWTPKDAEALLRAAIRFCRNAEKYEVPDDDEDRWHSGAEWRTDLARLAAVRMGARIAAWSGRTELLPLLLEALDWHEQLRDREDEFSRDSSVADAIQFLLERGAPPAEAIQALAHHPREVYREALATGLAARPEANEAALRSLADDPSPDVRQVVSKALAKLGGPSWWVGVFGQDPGRMLDPADVERLGPRIVRLVEILNEAYGLHSHEDEAVEILGEIPDALAADAIHRVLQTEHCRAEEKLAARLAPTREGVDVVVALADRKAAGRSYHVRRFLETWSADPRAHTEANARKLLDAARARPAAEHREWDSAATELWNLAKAVWPEDLDPGDALDDVVAEIDLVSEVDWQDRRQYTLDSIAAHSKPAKARYRERILAEWVSPAARSNEAGPGIVGLRSFRDQVLKEVEGDELRALAARALKSGNPEAVGWGVSELLGRAWDPEKDPPREQLVETLAEDPAVRERMLHVMAVTEDFPGVILGWLRAGRLSADEAMSAIRVLGGTDQLARSALKFGSSYEKKGVLEPGDFEIFRVARDARPLEWIDEHLGELLGSLPLGPLHPSDRALLDRSLRQIREGDDRSMYGAAMALAACGTAADLPAMDELVALEARKDERDFVDNLRDHLCERLGVAIPEKTRRAPAEEPDDDDDWPDDD